MINLNLMVELSFDTIDVGSDTISSVMLTHRILVVELIPI